MRMISARRIAQLFFFLLFLWFCLVSTLGDRLWQLRGWPVNWFLQLDPLVGAGVLLATRTLYRGLLWGVVTIVLTLFLGRFFCGWICPMGTLQQWIGYLSQRRATPAQRIRRNQPHRAQLVKYGLLLFLLAAACAELLHFFFGSFSGRPVFFTLLFSLVAAMLWVICEQTRIKAVLVFSGVVASGVVLYWWSPQAHWLAGSLQVGLLDPIVFITRAANLVILPIIDNPYQVTSAIPRFYEGVGFVGALFMVVLVLCTWVPRFYCRFVCPLGALYGFLGRWAVWRIGKSEDRCRECKRCEDYCEGACAPTQVIQTSECVLCLNCMDRCRHGLMAYQSKPSAAGEQQVPDLRRRHVFASIVLGLAAAPSIRLNASLGVNWNPDVLRPPGALAETQFLSRCIKCGQCMRICPTNVIHPATWEAGAEGLWTPVLNYRIGTSGCQHSCVACSTICPTAALRPLTVDERMGRNRYATGGPLRIGMAFVNRGRCLPWAMDTPCIVCQENCPVSPKAIFTRTEFRPIRDGLQPVRSTEGNRIVLAGGSWSLDALSGGDYTVQWNNHLPVAIAGNVGGEITLAEAPASAAAPVPGDTAQIRVRLQKPYVDPHRCIGCGICEHECPVQGRRAIRVTAENESRHIGRRMVIR